MLTFVFTLLFILPIGILDAYVIRDMWLWFAVPALAVNPITAVQAFGLNLLVQAFISRAPSSEENKDPSLMPMIALTIGILVTWFIGYIVHSYF
jgi:hypothetical protein